MKTPTLDGLAARGTRFTRAYTPSPICISAQAFADQARVLASLGVRERILAMPSFGHIPLVET